MALTLTLLGRYLALAHSGDIRQRDKVGFQAADAETQGGHAFRVIAAYAGWLAGSGHGGAGARGVPVAGGVRPPGAGRLPWRHCARAPVITGPDRATAGFV